MDNTTLFFTIFNFSGHFPILDSLMIFAANYLIYFIYALVVILALFGEIEEKGTLIKIMIGTLFTKIFIALIHLFVFQARPFVTYDFTPLIPPPGIIPSFPSTHTALISMIAFTYLLNKSRITKPMLVALFLIGFSRIYVGVHYPADILGGIFTGFVSASLALIIFRWLKKRNLLRSFQ